MFVPFLNVSFGFDNKVIGLKIYTPQVVSRKILL